MKYDVFISYSRKDYVDKAGNIIEGNIITQIKELLASNGYTYWFDESGIYSGDEFVGVITEAIQDSEIFLFVSSANSNKSEWTNHEIAVAKLLKKKTIPFKVDNAIYNTSILMYLAPLDFIDYPKNPAKAFDALIASLKNHYEKLDELQKRHEEEEKRKKKEQEEAEAKLKAEEAKNTRLAAIDNESATLNNDIEKQMAAKLVLKSKIEQLKEKMSGYLSDVDSIDEQIKSIYLTISNLEKEKGILSGNRENSFKPERVEPVNTSVESEGILENAHWAVKGIYILAGMVAFALACFSVYNGIKLGYTSAITPFLSYTFASLMAIVGADRILKSFRDGLVWMLASVVGMNVLEFVTLVWTKGTGLVHPLVVIGYNRVEMIGFSLAACLLLALPMFVPKNGVNLWSQMKTTTLSLKNDKLRLVFVILAVLMVLSMAYNRLRLFI